MTDNIEKIVQEAECVAAADEYFKARAWLMDTNDNRRIFEAGFDRAYALLSKLRAEGVQAGDERPLPKWLDLASLRRRAQKASAGEWQSFVKEGSNVFDVHLPDNSPVIHWMGFDGTDMPRKQKAANARYIAAAGPRTVLALLDALEGVRVAICPICECPGGRHSGGTLCEQASAPVAGEPFMYGIMGPDRKAHFEEFCVSGDRSELQTEVVDHLNRDNPEDGTYSVVALFREPAPQASEAVRPALAVWYGSMPESNGKSNWTAILHRKGDGLMDGPHVTIDRSEYPDRVRYEADRVRYLIGEIDKEPWILDYDADKCDAPQAAKDGGDGAKGAVVLSEPLRVFSAGMWTYDGTGQAFSHTELDAAAFVTYRDALSPTQPTEQGERDA